MKDFVQSLCNDEKKKDFSNIKKEAFRKSIHMMSSFAPLFAHFTSPALTIFCLSVMAMMYSIFEFFRCNGRRVMFFSRIVELANRKESQTHFSLGPITLSLGIIASLYLFPLYVATIAIFSLSFGDGLASLAGKMFGRDKFIFEGKTIAGSIGCFVATFIAELAFTHSVVFSFCVAFFTTIIELIPLKDFDNVVIPISIGFLSECYFFFVS